MYQEHVTCYFLFTMARADFPHVRHTEVDVAGAGQDTEGDEVVGPIPLPVPGPKSEAGCGCGVYVGCSVPVLLCLISASWLLPPIWVPLMCPRMGSSKGEVVMQLYIPCHRLPPLLPHGSEQHVLHPPWPWGRPLYSRGQPLHLRPGHQRWSQRTFLQPPLPPRATVRDPLTPKTMVTLLAICCWYYSDFHTVDGLCPLNHYCRRGKGGGK